MCNLLIEPIAVQTDRVNSLHEDYRVVKRLSEKLKNSTWFKARIAGRFTPREHWMKYAVNDGETEGSAEVRLSLLEDANVDSSSQPILRHT